MRFILSVTRAALGVLVAVVVLAGVGGGCYWFSLVTSLHGLEAGIRERDVVKLEKYVDWGRIRDQVRADLQAFMMTQVFKEAKKGEEGGLASSIGTLLAGAVAPAVIDRVVDGFVTPQALVRLLTERPPSEQPDLTFVREGFTDLDEYTLLLGASSPTRPRIRAILRRDGITWRAVRVVFPPGEAPWETKATGLQLGKVTPSRTTDALIVEGDVTNTSQTGHEVPRLRVTLRDPAEREVQVKTIDPPKDRLMPGEVAHFKAQFDHPDEAATGVVVRFAPEAGVTLPDPILQPSNAKPDTSATDAPVGAPAALRQLGSAKETKIAHQSIERLAGVLDIYKLDVGTYPTTEQGLLALVERPSGVTHWNGPYLKGDKVPEDPWGRLFVYHNPSQRPGHKYDLYSLGPTGQPGGTGDAATIFND